MNRKTFISISFLILIIVIAGVVGYAESPSPPKSLPPQGLYDSSDPSTAESRAHLDKFAKAGFKLIINYGVFDYEVTDIMSYADHANAVGMKVIWDMSSRPYRDGTFSREYICERVEAVKTHPATWGYYVADEPGDLTPNDIGSERGPVKALSDYVHQLDPAHPRFIVHWYEDDPTRTLRPYVDFADVIALDIYTTAAGSPAEDVGAAARASQELADKKGKQWAIVLQSFDGAQYKKEIPDACPGWPDRERMLKERNLVLKNSRPAFILWYSYFDILKSSDPTGHWADLVAAAFSPEPSVEPTSMPIFPIGLYAVDALPYSNKVTEEFSDIAAAGFNVIQSYQFEQDIEGDNAVPTNTNESARGFLDAAHKSGLKVLMGIPQECVLKRNFPCIRERVLALKDHPALFGWQLYDEPEQDPPRIPALPLDNLLDAYQEIKRLDALHPVTIAASNPVDASYLYRKGADIVMPELLVIPTDVWYGETSLGNVVRDIVGPSTALLTQEGKSTLPHVQAYNLATDPLIWKDVPISYRGRYPTREEMRFSAYYSIILGAKGVFFNCYRYNYDGGESPLDDISRKASPKQWQAVSSVASELKLLSPILSTPTLEHTGIIVTGNQAAIMLKKYQNRYYLFIATPSSDASEFEVRFAPDRFPNPRIMLYSEKRNIQLTENSFTDQWKPYDVRIYVISTGKIINK